MPRKKNGQKKSSDRGRPRCSYDRAATDAAARSARLVREGYGERAAARIVDAAERLGHDTSEALLVAGERRQRQRLAEAERRGPIDRPSTETVLCADPEPCSCSRWPTEHSHCRGCGAPVDAEVQICDRESCYRTIYWGSVDAAQAARAAAQREGRDRRIRLLCAICHDQLRSFADVVEHLRDAHGARTVAEARAWAAYLLVLAECMAPGRGTERLRDLWRRAGVDDALVDRMVTALVDAEPWTLLGRRRRPPVSISEWERRRRRARRPPPAPLRPRPAPPVHVTCSYCHRDITASAWRCSACGERYYTCPACEPDERGRLLGDHTAVCAAAQPLPRR